MNPLSRAMRSVREKGLPGAVSTGAGWLQDVYFDWRYGVDTVTRDDLADLPPELATRAFAVPYTASRVRAVRECLARLRPDPAGTLCDVGCGKGRVLLLAAEYGFRRAVGVELSASLCAKARENARRYLARTGCATEIEVLENDAGSHEFRGDENLVFLFNPFTRQVLERVLDNLERSLAETPRPLHLVYNNPVEQETLVGRRHLRLDGELELCGNSFLVYRT